MTSFQWIGEETGTAPLALRVLCPQHVERCPHPFPGSVAWSASEIEIASETFSTRVVVCWGTSSVIENACRAGSCAASYQRARGERRRPTGVCVGWIRLDDCLEPFSNVLQTHVVLMDKSERPTGADTCTFQYGTIGI